MDYTSPEVNNGALGALLVVWTLFAIAIYVVTVIGLWKMFVKAGKPGWAAIIPFYNWWVWVEIIGRPTWWFWALVASALLSWIPILGWILSVAVFVLYLLGCLDMAKCFGKGGGFGIGLWLLPFVFAPILGFGDAQYLGPVAAPAGGVGASPPPPPGGYGLPSSPPAPPAPPAQPFTPPAPVTPAATAPAEAAPATPAVEAAPARAGGAGRGRSRSNRGYGGRRSRGPGHAAAGACSSRGAAGRPTTELAAGPAAAHLKPSGT